jgi:hypothetical protein
MYGIYNKSQFCVLTSYILLGIYDYKLCKRIPSPVCILKHHSSYEFRFYGPASSQAQERLLVSFKADPTVQDGMVVRASACWLGQVILKSTSVHIW